MTILNLIPIGFIGTGLIFGSIASDINKKVNNKISNEKIYLFPSEIESINKSNSIIKIERDFMTGIRKNPIGYVRVNKIVKVPIVVYKNVYNIILDKYSIQKYIEYEEIKKIIGSQILFPHIHDKIIIDSDLLLSKKINVLINNSNFTKSSNKNLIERYEKIIRCNIPNFTSDLIIDSAQNLNNLELEENILGDNSDLYLMVNPSNDKLIANTISESSEFIIREKYKDDIDVTNELTILSFSFIGIGMIIGIIGIISKN
jgi:hypothetical protein